MPSPTTKIKKVSPSIQSAINTNLAPTMTQRGVGSGQEFLRGMIGELAAKDPGRYERKQDGSPGRSSQSEHVEISRPIGHAHGELRFCADQSHRARLLGILQDDHK